MSDISISAMTPQSMAFDEQSIGIQSVGQNSNTEISGVNPDGMDQVEMAPAGAELASRNTEFFGSGTDFSSTGTDVDIQKAVSNALMDGTGSIADKVA
ncbi:hypothetical protein [Pseudodesulfovibrio tunisiensis]|uniref:hypothetical protein n=1 Tax=Pseudodesulfovibrio tunisiensis TaxID=463192 RepID=UPI001FB47002|nr:hypothetical protein [Pseudodesulfovibrio tunisiensis]